MGVLKWIFNLNESCRKEQRKYAKKSNTSKIVELVISALFTIGAVVLVWFTLKSFTSNVGLGILLAILSVATVLAMAKMNGISCFVALRNPIAGAVQDKVYGKLNEMGSDLATELGQETQKPVVTEEMKEAKTNSRVLDIISGLIYGVLAVGVVVASVIMLINAIIPPVA